MIEQLRNIVSQLPFLDATRDGRFAEYAEPVALTIILLAIGALAILAHGMAKGVITRIGNNLTDASESSRSSVLLRRSLLERLAHLAPALVVYSLAPAALMNYPTAANLFALAALIYLVWVAALVLDALLDALLEISQHYDFARELPLKSVIQILKLAVYFLAFMLVLSLLLGQPPLQLLAGLGAMTAVLMLVFKDPILGFVAGIQLSSNKMVAVGDWIEIPQHGVDGDVLEIALTTVKVRNFDNTITTVPTQTLINDSFKNWRGMQESGGRRIKRAVLIDLSSIRFCDEAMLGRLAKINFVSDYLKHKRKELEKFNANLDLSSPANGRRLTNVGTFRAYIEAYLRNHSQISQTLTLLVRQLKPTELGLPIEIYVFSKEKRWIEYEAIVADIFDHIFAAAPEFDLRLFQNPAGHDLARLRS